MSAMIWGGETHTSPNGEASILLHGNALDSRLSALREVAVALLSELESLEGAQMRRQDDDLRLQEQVKRFEIGLIRTALHRTGGNQARAARLLGVKHTTLNAKIKRYKIPLNTNGVEREQDLQSQNKAA